MKKRLRNRWLVNLGLLLSVLILSVILILGESPPPEKTTLASYLPEEITDIRITRKGKSAIVMSKQNGHWLMTSPYRVTADDLQVRLLLSLSAIEITAELDSKNVKPEDLGLAGPDVIIEFNQVRISLGGNQPVNRLRYIRVADRIMLVSDKMDAPLNASSLSLIDRHLVPVGKEVVNIRIDGEFLIADAARDKTGIQLSRSWKDTRANWISIHPDEEFSGIPVLISLKDHDDPLTYIAQKRDTDLVLINQALGLEYHLPHSAIQTLGLPFADPGSTKDSPAAGNEQAN